MTETLRDLAEHIRTHQEALIDRWQRACKADGELELVSRLTRKQFRNNIPAAIDELCDALVADGGTPPGDGIAREVARHGHHRWKQGFNLWQLIRDWGHFNQVLVNAIDDYFRERPPEDASRRSLALDRLAGYMTEAVGGSVRRFDELKRAEAASLAEDLADLRDEFERISQARGKMLRELAHDIRGGLAAVMSASDVLKLSAEGNQSLSSVLDIMERGIRSVSDMLESLRDLSRLEAGADPVELISVDIAEVLAELAAQHRGMAENKGVALHCDGPEHMRVCTDPRKVRRIVQNLLVNALQHTHEGAVHLSWASAKDRWTIEVADTGPGIQDVVGSPVARELDEPDRSRSPSPPTKTLSYTGEGIGLTIVKRLCELLDAAVSLESELGKGTTVRVELPSDESLT
jgi:signal transduction histidine kinase